MKHIITLIFISILTSQVFAHWVNTTQGTSEQTDTAKYACALISNGSISTQIDNLGVQKQKRYVSFSPRIAWAGRRYGPPRDALIPFGNFDTSLTINNNKQQPLNWTQSLNNKEAFSYNKVEYQNAFIETIAFVPMQHNMLVVKKIITPKINAEIKFDFIYNFDNYSRIKKTNRVFIDNFKSLQNGISIDYTALGYHDYIGTVSVLSNYKTATNFDSQKKLAIISTKTNKQAKESLEICYFITFADNFGKDKNFVKKNELLQKIVTEQGFDKIFQKHKNAWEDYWKDSYIDIPNKEIQKTYYTGLYHQRCNATRWSLPVGVFCDSHWHGRFFGWDEAFNAMALASSGKFDQSRKPSDYRQNTITKALYRANKPHKNMKRKNGALYMWEALEDGGEGAPQGFWIDHIFHMSNMTMATWRHYLYSNDEKFLRRNFDVMIESALYYIKHQIYQKNDDYIVGKCTDLERMGSAKENPFMTSCGIIYTLEKTADASDILGIDKDTTKDFRNIAKSLRKTLPHDNEKYVPYPESKDYSIGSVGGFYPYETINANDKLGKNAVYEFLKNIDKGGNMYDTGKGVNAWYAGWMASALVNFNDTENPAKLLDAAAKETGAFYDTFEINEPHNNVQRCPWFSTGSGNYIYAVNQMLVHPTENNEIMLCTSVPKAWNDISFNLPSYKGLWVKAEIKNGKLHYLSLYAKGYGKKGTKQKIIVPSRFIDEKILTTDWKKVGEFYHIEKISQ
ncbi:MAG: hypothetical protein J6B07_02870 [Opitutales bacterium]|nr:hypothetical protein [Opitutales bacterium]